MLVTPPVATKPQVEYFLTILVNVELRYIFALTLMLGITLIPAKSSLPSCGANNTSVNS